MDSSQQIFWRDDIDSSRCKIPQRLNQFEKISGWLGIGVGLLIASWPFLMRAFFYFAMSDSETEDGKLLTSVLSPSLLFGVFCFPISGFAFLKGLLILRGRMEMV